MVSACRWFEGYVSFCALICITVQVMSAVLVLQQIACSGIIVG